MVDSHVHFWKYDADRYNWIGKDMKLLQQDYLPQQLQSVLKNNGIERCVAVYADATELETHFLLELASKYDFIKAVVGWIDVQGADLNQRLTYFSQFSLLRGLGYDARAKEKDFFALPAIISAVKNIAGMGFNFDLLLHYEQLAGAVELVKNVPGGNFILNHLGSPDIAHKEFELWATGIRLLAEQPGVSCKLSGLFTQATWKNWSPGDFYPYLDVVFKAFGTQRVMFGSDWPIMLVSGMYVQWKSLLLKYMEQFDEETIEGVMGGNAERIYRLQ